MPDGPAAFLPKSKFWRQTILNPSVTDHDRRRIDEVYGIGYGDNIDTALAILRRITDEEPRVLQDPAPLIKWESLGDISVNILFRVWTARADWFATKLDLVQRCKAQLEQGGASMPFPQREMHVTQPATAWLGLARQRCRAAAVGAAQLASTASTARIWPSLTCCPSAASTCCSTPAAVALIGISIFIDSMIRMVSPSASVSPG